MEKKQIIDPDLRGVVYTLVAENGEEKEFDIFLNLYKNETLHQEKDRIARALTAFKKQDLINKTLSWSISSEVRSQDAPRILYATFVNPAGRDVAWNFLTTH